MSEKDGKTEKPTPKKIRDARKKGEMAKSQELSSALTFIVFALFGVSLITFTLQQSYPFLRNMLAISILDGDVRNNLNQIGMKAIAYFFILAGPFLAIAFLSGILANLVQIGFFFSGEPLKFKFSRLNPISGLKNMFSKKVLFNLAKNLIKLGLIVWMAFSSLEQASYYVLNAGKVGPEKMFFLLLEIVKEISFKLAILLMILGIADFAYQKYDHQKKLYMTKQEIKDEYKEMEGDPQMKGMRKQRYREMTRMMLKDVESASIVITNPTHLAIAIRYDKTKDAVPVIVAKGTDHMAAIIRERAKEHQVPLMENKPLAQAMYQKVEIGMSIPNDFYQAIAEMLAVIYQMNEMKKKKI